jgi:hypothetical protein
MQPVGHACFEGLPAQLVHALNSCPQVGFVVFVPAVSRLCGLRCGFFLCAREASVRALAATGGSLAASEGSAVALHHCDASF